MEFIFHLWEGDQKRLKISPFRRVFHENEIYLPCALKINNTFIINQLKQKTQQKTIMPVARKCHFCDLVQTINENIISIFIENEITKP
ncbi:hypothetical protein AWJ61_01895 [Salmonella enterica subsp. enterica serovar Agona str. 400095 22]|nr:hypothetical protein AWJ61_01895 [Salmonella enterica subsp. enterica serovar Agona str. 400095 22]